MAHSSKYSRAGEHRRWFSRTSKPSVGAVDAELDRLTAEFFRAVSFEAGGAPPFENIYALFIESGLVIKNAGSTPEICTVRQLIEPRQATVTSGGLTRFLEAELSEITEIFGNVAHRFSAYTKLVRCVELLCSANIPSRSASR